MAKLEVGERYLRIKIVGHEPVAAFKNVGKNKPGQPDYKSDGVAVWIYEKKASKANEHGL